MKNIKDMTNEEREQAMVETDLKQRDAKLSLSERKKAREKHLELLLNPVKEFDPDTFQPGISENDESYELRKRERLNPPRRLPTLGLKPRKILEGQMVGMYESKQDLYLLIAWLSERLSDLEDEVRTPKGGGA